MKPAAFQQDISSDPERRREPEWMRRVIANDLMQDDFPRVNDQQSLSEGLGRFLGLQAERLPVIDDAGRLVGSWAKGDLLLTYFEQIKPASPPPAEPS